MDWHTYHFAEKTNRRKLFGQQVYFVASAPNPRTRPGQNQLLLMGGISIDLFDGGETQLTAGYIVGENGGNTRQVWRTCERVGCGTAHERAMVGVLENALKEQLGYALDQYRAFIESYEVAAASGQTSG